jgi:hypothetical protein
MARLFARMLAFALALTAAAGATAQTYTYTFYVGNTNANGCTIQTPAGPVGHVKWRLQATVTGGVAPSVGAFTRSDCSNNVFGAPSAVSSTSAVGLNSGPGGTDVIEVQLPVGVVGPTPSPREILAVVASSNAGSDGLIATVFNKDGLKGTLPGGIVPITIPTAGVFTLVLLGLVLAALAWRTLRRRGHLLMLSLLLIAGTAWAVAIVVDGQTADWASVTGNSDPAGDSGGQAAIDLRALFVTTQASNGYVRVDVVDLENPPVANAGSAGVLEDGSVAITLTGSDPNNAPLTFQIAGSPTLGTLSAITPINASSASVIYTPNLDEFGGDSFTFTVSNGTQTSSPATMSITITPVNDAPSFGAANPPAVNEGAGAQSVPGWATFDAGPANEASQSVLAYQVTNVSAPALFAAGPAVAANGTLTYTLAADANGSATFDVAVQDNGGTANGGVDTSAAQSFTITVNAVNDAPDFTGGGDASAPEDADAQLVAGWATGIDDGDADAAQALAFQVTGNTNAALFATGPTVDAGTGNLSFTPAADANGSATITLVLSDDGGTANGGVDTSAAYNFDIAITAVNDAPSFTAVDPPAVNEGSGSQSVPNWAAFDPGPVNESGQAVAEYQVGAIGNPGLFAVAPSVANDGTLTYTVAPDVSGSSSFSVAVRDNGGTANGGVDLSVAQVFTVMVNAVNSAPSFAGGGDASSDEDAGAQSVPAWATAIDDGDLDQVQNLTFAVTGNTNPALFAAGPAVDPGSGDLTYTAAADASGSATITLVLSDDGGTANGGSDSSAPYDFTIVVNPINDAPTATAKAHSTHSAIELEIVAASHGGELLEGAADVDDPAGDLSAVLVPGSITPPGAQVTITNAGDGSFRYDPPGGYSGAGGFQFQVCDDGIPAAPQQCSAATTVSFTITGPDLYFIDDGAAPGGDGGLNDPFDAISDLPPGRGNNDRIFVFSGNYPAAAHAFFAGEHLVGQGASGSFDALLGVTTPGNGTLDARPALTGVEADRPVLDRITMSAAHNAAMRGVALSSNSADAVSISGSNALTIAESSAASSAGGVTIVGSSASAAGVSFSSVSSSGGINGIVLADLAGPGSFDFGAGSLSGNTGVAFRGTGTLANTSYAGDISKISAGNLIELTGGAAATDTGSVTLSGTLACSGACAGIDVVDRDAGTLAFSGSGKSLNTGANAAVTLDNNDGANIAFSGGGLAIATTSGIGFNAVNGAAGVTVEGAGNSIASGTGIALNVANTAIGANDLTFRSISSNGASSGIVLNSTGGAGGLTVTGSGTAGSGGTIRNGASGVLLSNTRDVSLSRMQLNDFGDFAIRGTSVVNFALADSVVSGTNGNDAGADEGSVRFNELTGTASVTNSSISGSVEHNMQVVNTAGLLDRLTVSGTTFGAMNPATGSDALLIETLNTAVINATVQNNFFTYAVGDHFQFSANGSTANDVVFAGNTVSNTGVVAVAGGGGVRIFGGNNSGTAAPGDDVNASISFGVAGNTLRDARGSALAVNKLGGSGTFSGTIENNNVGLASVADSGSAEGSAISVVHDFGGAHTIAIRGNTVSQYANFGIFAQAGGSGIVGSGTLNATVTGNTVSAPGNLAFIKNGAHLNGGVSAGDSYAICFDLGGAGALANTLVGSGDDGGTDFRLRHRQSTTVRLPGYVGGAFDTGAVVAFEQARNAGAETGQAATSGLGGGFVGGVACPQP